MEYKQMQYEALICEQQDSVVLVTLNRPDKRNALSRLLRDEIVACLGELESSEDVHAIVLTGAGVSFCAGFDLSEFQTGDMEEIFTHATSYHHKVHNCSKPIVAAVNGNAMAGGMDLAAMCDLRIAAVDSMFGQPQVKMGIEAAYDLMSTVLPGPLARELCLTGRPMNANEALSVHFVNEVVEADQLLEHAHRVAETIAASGYAMKPSFLQTQPDLFS